MALHIKAFVTMPDGLNSIPETLMEKNRLLQVVLWPLHICPLTHTLNEQTNSYKAKKEEKLNVYMYFLKHLMHCSLLFILSSSV